MDSSKDCLSHCKVSKVIAKYFVSGNPSVIFLVPFGSLGAFDDWRYQRGNQNKVVVSLHIKYGYDSDYLSEDGCILE